MKKHLKRFKNNKSQESASKAVISYLENIFAQMSIIYNLQSERDTDYNILWIRRVNKFIEICSIFQIRGLSNHND